MTIYQGTLPYGGGVIKAYADSNTAYFKSSRLAASSPIDDDGSYRLALPVAGTYRVRVSTRLAAYPDVTVTASAGTAVGTLTLGAPVLRSTPTVPSVGAGSGASLTDLKAAFVGNTDGVLDSIKPPRSQVGPTSRHSDVLPYLPPMQAVNDGRIRTHNTIRVHSLGVLITWTEDSLTKIIIQNPASNSMNMQIGYGTYGDANIPATPDVITPGQEWVGFASSRPIAAKAASGYGYVTVITERAA